MSRFCTFCGSSSAGGSFCTSCGAQFGTSKPPPPSSPMPPQSRPTSKLRCVDCGSQIEAGLVCARCASRPQAPARIAPSATSPPRHQTSDTRDVAYGSGAKNLWIGLLAWALVSIVVAAWANHKIDGGLASVVPGLSSSLDGTYTCGEYDWPMTVKIDGRKGSINLGFVRGDFMSAQRYGDTLTLSGGIVADDKGRTLSPEERRALSGGNDVEVFTIANDGQTLKLDLGNGRTATFAKQAR